MRNFKNSPREDKFDNKRDSLQMHQAVCDKCGDHCEVPFKPSSDKPIYCSNCFKKDSNFDSKSNEKSNKKNSFSRTSFNDDYSDRKNNRNNDWGKSSFEDKKMYKAICADCGDACEVPFKPSSGKPVYCSSCFSQGNNGNNIEVKKTISSNKEDFEALNKKLDKILKILEIIHSKKSFTIEKPIID